jgi:DNA recombination protein RmuC
MSFLTSIPIEWVLVFAAIVLIICVLLLILFSNFKRQQQTIEQEYSVLRQQYSDLQQQQSTLTETSNKLQLSLVACETQQSNDQQQIEELQIQRSQYDLLKTDHAVLQARTESQQESLNAQLQNLTEAKQQLTKEFELVANRIFEDKQKSFSAHSKTTLDASVNPLREQLQEFRKKVEDVYGKEAAERNQLVGQITELQKQTQKIGADALNLANAIKGDNKAQGNWGEVILERLLEESGLQKGREYDVQVSLTSEDGRRRNPDVIIRLPEKKDIIIDSKVSLVSYERYYSCEDMTQKKEYLKQHVVSLRSHIKQLSLKSYENLEGIRTLDFVFIFIPVEAAFMLALQEEPGLFKEAYDKHIVLVSPTTLLATLRTVENIWRYEKQNKNAEEIARQAGGLYDQFVLMVDSLDDIGKQINKANIAYETAQKRLSTGKGNLLKRVEDLRTLGAKTKRQLPEDKLEGLSAETSLLENSGLNSTKDKETQ